jgi:hypothetical protein
MGLIQQQPHSHKEVGEESPKQAAATWLRGRNDLFDLRPLISDALVSLVHMQCCRGHIFRNRRLQSVSRLPLSRGGEVMWGCFSYKQVNKEFESRIFLQVKRDE